MDAQHGMSPDEHPHRARSAETEHEPSKRVLVFEAFLAADREALEALERQGYTVVRRADGRSLLEEIVQQPPSVVVFGLRPDRAEDLGLLHLVRRAVPEVPLILLAGRGSLETQRLVQSLHPIYYGLCPLDPGELGEAVEAAVTQQHIAEPAIHARRGAARPTQVRSASL